MTVIKHDGRQLTLMTITPELAKIWLETHDHGNRPIIQSALDKYTRMMRAGKWPFVGDPIRFSITGRLLDGQHRLLAVVNSSTTQQMIVLRGADETDQNFMDVGAGRRAGQQLTMNGLRNGNVAASIVRMVIRWQTETLTSNNFNPAIAETVEFADRYAERLEAATQIAVDVYKATSLKRPAVGAVAFVAFDMAATYPEKLSVDTVWEFFDLVRTGEGLAHGNPILALRAHALRNRKVKVAFQPEASVVYYIVRTWNAWRNSDMITKLQLPRDTTVTPAHLKLI